jgi:murein DD-endopeptidase MepM/ murein hydrolase activator NlpD
MRKGFIITISREASGDGLRIRLDVRAFIVGIFLLAGTPLLIEVVASRAAGHLSAELLRQNSALRIENASYRETAAKLVEQVTALQAAADDLRTRAAVDPTAARAMNALPSAITHAAMGGGSSVTEVAAPVASVVSSAEPAFGLLRDVLHIIERKLDQVRPGVERREALAAATPSIWPVPGWLSSRYGNRTDPFTGAPDFHTGLDISADSGEPVRATADGTVSTARASGNYGNLVTLDHGFGIGTRYGHLLRLAVVEGQRVRRGDIVGYVGSTGRSTSPHVHYEITFNGRPANPLRLLGR